MTSYAHVKEYESKRKDRALIHSYGLDVGDTFSVASKDPITGNLSVTLSVISKSSCHYYPYSYSPVCCCCCCFVIIAILFVFSYNHFSCAI